MAQLDQVFDATHVDPTPRFDPIPAGDYPVIITESQFKYTKDNNGQYLELRLEVQSGEFAGRLVFDRLNLFNHNRQAVEIAQRQLSQICHAVGVMQITDSEQLHYKPLMAMVKVRAASGQYDASNEVKGYKPLPNAAPVMQPPRAAAAPPARQAAPPAPPARQAAAAAPPAKPPRAPWEKTA
jgi:hypothetical protein